MIAKRYWLLGVSAAAQLALRPTRIAFTALICKSTPTILSRVRSYIGIEPRATDSDVYAYVVNVEDRPLLHRPEVDWPASAQGQVDHEEHGCPATLDLR